MDQPEMRCRMPIYRGVSRRLWATIPSSMLPVQSESCDLAEAVARLGARQADAGTQGENGSETSARPIASRSGQRLRTRVGLDKRDGHAPASGRSVRPVPAYADSAVFLMRVTVCSANLDKRRALMLS